MSKSLVSDTLCNSILSTNKNIQSVILINKQGRPVEKISRSQFTTKFQDNMSEMFFMQCVLQVSMGRDFDECYGPINYHISERTNLVMLSFPLDDHVLLVIVNKNVSPISLARKIANMVNESQKQPFCS
jgi:hypothetical protein